MSSPLPPELLDRILDYLWDDHSALRACSLTCRSWVATTRIYIFGDVQAHVHCQKDCDELEGLLRGPCTSRPTRYMRVLKIGRSSPFHAEPHFCAQTCWLERRVPRLLADLTGVEDLRLVNVIWATAIPQALMGSMFPNWLRTYIALPPSTRTSIQTFSPKIRILTLRLVWFEGHGMLEEFLTSFPQLAELDIERMMVTPQPRPCGACSPPPATLDLSSLGRLSIVHIRVSTILNQDCGWEILDSIFAPSVQELCITFRDLASDSHNSDELAFVRKQWERWDKAVSTLHRRNPHVLIRMTLECLDFGINDVSALEERKCKYEAYLDRLTHEMVGFFPQSIRASARILLSCMPPKEMPLKTFWLTRNGPLSCLEGSSDSGEL